MLSSHPGTAPEKRFLDTVDDITVVGTAASGGEVWPVIEAKRPDVLILDINLPGMKGAKSVEEFRAEAPHVPIVVFSMHEEDQYALTMLQRGASAYLTKSRDPEELVEAIRRAGRGERYLTSNLASLMLELGGKQSVGTPLHETLSTREREVFDLLIAGQSAKQIAKRLDVSASTVHTYVERIKTKLAVDSIPQVIRYAFQNGLS